MLQNSYKCLHFKAAWGKTRNEKASTRQTGHTDQTVYDDLSKHKTITLIRTDIPEMLSFVVAFWRMAYFIFLSHYLKENI
jgi:hypothetical protein